jgi:hypothetical protein
MRRKIIERRYYRTPSHPKRAGDSVIIGLVCGHLKHYKASKEPRGSYALCQECDLPERAGDSVTIGLECGHPASRRYFPG